MGWNFDNSTYLMICTGFPTFFEVKCDIFVKKSINKRFKLPWGRSKTKNIHFREVILFLSHSHGSNIKEHLVIFIYKLFTIRGLASDPSARLFRRAFVIWDGKKTDHFGPFYTILGHFGHFRPFWTGTNVQKDGQFRNSS